MEILQSLLPVILYSLGIVLVIVLIILGIRSIQMVTKINIILDETKDKLDSLNSFFNIMDTINDKMSAITDTMISAVTSMITSIFKRRKNKKEEIEDYE